MPQFLLDAQDTTGTLCRFALQNYWIDQIYPVKKSLNRSTGLKIVQFLDTLRELIRPKDDTETEFTKKGRYVKMQPFQILGADFADKLYSLFPLLIIYLK